MAKTMASRSSSGVERREPGGELLGEHGEDLRGCVDGGGVVGRVPVEGGGLLDEAVHVGDGHQDLDAARREASRPRSAGPDRASCRCRWKPRADPRRSRSLPGGERIGRRGGPQSIEFGKGRSREVGKQPSLLHHPAGDALEHHRDPARCTLSRCSMAAQARTKAMPWVKKRSPAALRPTIGSVTRTSWVTRSQPAAVNEWTM